MIRVACYEVRVAGYVLRVAGYGHGLQIAGSECLII